MPRFVMCGLKVIHGPLLLSNEAFQKIVSKAAGSSQTWNWQEAMAWTAVHSMLSVNEYSSLQKLKKMTGWTDEF